MAEQEYYEDQWAAKKAQRDRQESNEVKEAVEALSRIANRGLSAKLFVEHMNREHRTLQQSMTSLMLAWFKHLASLSENQYDLRNEASVKTARKVMTAVDGYIGLPHI